MTRVATCTRCSYTRRSAASTEDAGHTRVVPPTVGKRVGIALTRACVTAMTMEVAGLTMASRLTPILASDRTATALLGMKPVTAT